MKYMTDHKSRVFSFHLPTKKFMAIIIALGIVASTAFVIVIYPSNEKSIDLNLFLRMRSASTGDEYAANYSWHASGTDRDVYGTHIQWKNQYAKAEVNTTGELSEIIYERFSNAYISWSQMTLLWNDSWSLQVDLQMYTTEMTVHIDGNNISVVHMNASLTDSYITELLKSKLRNLGVDELQFVGDFSFHIKGSIIRDFFESNQGRSYSVADDIDGVITSYAVGTIQIG